MLLQLIVVLNVGQNSKVTAQRLRLNRSTSDYCLSSFDRCVRSFTGQRLVRTLLANLFGSVLIYGIL